MWRAVGQGRESAGHGMGGLDRGEVAEGSLLPVCSSVSR
jgi:hypothetical protein